MRLLICAAGLAASLATPGLAVAHGHAHRELAEHLEIADAHGMDAHDADHHAVATPIVSSTDHDSDHPHGVIEQGVAPRSSALAPAVVTTVAVVAAATRTTVVAAEYTTCEGSTRCWAERPPSAPRAPPTVS